MCHGRVLLSSTSTDLAVQSGWNSPCIQAVHTAYLTRIGQIRWSVNSFLIRLCSYFFTTTSFVVFGAPAGVSSIQVIEFCSVHDKWRLKTTELQRLLSVRKPPWNSQDQG